MLKYFISISLLALVLIINACASPKTEAQVKFEQDKLLHDLFTLKTCRIEKTKELDDGISNVETIAVAVIKACIKESKYVTDNNMLEQSDEYKKVFFRQMNGVETSGVLNIVLQHRSKKDLDKQK